MTAQFKAPVCCGQTLMVSKDQKTGVFSYVCGKCKKSSSGKTPAEAAEKWGGASVGATSGKATGTPTANVPALPTGPGSLQLWANAHMHELVKSSAAYIEKPNITRMIEKNLKYIARHAGLEKAWATDEGRESIVEALEEALYIGATLPEMGSIVLFGSTAEFIPSVEAFSFALTTGKNSPFEWVAIECIYANDQYKLSRINGEFNLTFEHIPMTRGEVIGVAVYGKEKSRGIVVGDVYEKSSLMEKAEAHSKSYKGYLQDVAALNSARSAGQVQEENGRQYIVKNIPKREGGAWPKKIYLDDMHNPYEGGDQPEMLKKSAGKSFFRPWMKVRNSIEAAAEARGAENNADDSSVDHAIDNAVARAKDAVTPTFTGPGATAEDFSDVEIQDAEYSVEDAEQGSEHAEVTEPTVPEQKTKARAKMDDRG